MPAAAPGRCPCPSSQGATRSRDTASRWRGCAGPGPIPPGRTVLSAVADARAPAATEAWAAAEPGGLDRAETLSAHLAVDLLRSADRRQPRNAVSSETTASGRSSWRVWPQSSARPETVVAFSRQVASTS